MLAAFLAGFGLRTLSVNDPTRAAGAMDRRCRRPGTPRGRRRCVWQRPIRKRVRRHGSCSCAVSTIAVCDSFTSYLSRKGRELTENPHAAAVLYWRKLGRQARDRRRRRAAERGSNPTRTSTRARAAINSPRGHRSRANRSKTTRCSPIAFPHFASALKETTVPRPHSWGGYLANAVAHRVLAKPPQPYARTHALYAQRRCLGGESAATVR